MYDIIELNGKSLPELQEIAKELDIPKFEKLMKQDLIYKILDQQALIPQVDEKPAFSGEIKKKRGRKPKATLAAPAPAQEGKPAPVPAAKPQPEAK